MAKHWKSNQVVESGIYTLDEAKNLTGVSRVTLRKWIDEGRIDTEIIELRNGMKTYRLSGRSIIDCIESVREWDNLSEFDKMVRRRNRYKERHPERLIALQAVATAVARGKLRRPKKCSSCGTSGRIEGHHEDYGKPLEVCWLCPMCHTLCHKFTTYPPSSI